MKTIAVTAISSILIVHEFESEEAALNKMPFIKRWKRETWDKRFIRYHSGRAEKYWGSRKINDPITSSRVIHKL